MNATRPPRGNQDPDEPFIPDFSEGAETGLYLALLELLDEGLLITGDETVLEVNSAACRLLERDYRQIAGKPLADLFPSERDFLEARARLFIQGERRGSLRVALPDKRQRELGFVAAARIRPGLHALILRPGALADAPAADTPAGDTLWPRLAAALEQPVIVIDEHQCIVAANAAALGLLGLGRDSIVGRAVDSCLDIRWPAADAAPLATLRVPGRRGEIAARILPGPQPDWRLLVLPPATQPAQAAQAHAPRRAAKAVASGDAIGDDPLDRLEVHFQPLFDVRDGSLHGGEALLRWHHPDLGLIPFQRFAALARDAGQLARMGDWVLHAACAEAARWRGADGRPVRLTVNVAIEQMLHGDLAERVGHALESSGLPAAQLELDLDERVLNEENARLATTLAAIAQTGVRLAIDDFGRGLASIPRLKRYPLHALKLDPLLVREVGAREDSEAIVEAMSSMAGILGLEVLARGVEGEAQQAFLSALGCHLQQGPLFGKPMTAAAFRDFLRRPARSR